MKKCPECGSEMNKVHVRKIMRQCWGNMLHYGDDYVYECEKCEYRSPEERELTKVGEHYQEPWYIRMFKPIPDLDI